MSSRYLFLFLAILIIGVYLSQSAPVEPSTDKHGKWGYDYCGCGLHQHLPSGAYDYGWATLYTSRCYAYRTQCGWDDRSPESEGCKDYNQITDLYQERSCNPNWDNPEAVSTYCEVVHSHVCVNCWLKRLCSEQLGYTCENVACSEPIG